MIRIVCSYIYIYIQRRVSNVPVNKSGMIQVKEMTKKKKKKKKIKIFNNIIIRNS